MFLKALVVLLLCLGSNVSSEDATQITNSTTEPPAQPDLANTVSPTLLRSLLVKKNVKDVWNNGLQHLPAIDCYVCSGCKDTSALTSKDRKTCHGEENNMGDIDKTNDIYQRTCVEWKTSDNRSECIDPDPKSTDVYIFKPYCTLTYDAWGILARNCVQTFLPGLPTEEGKIMQKCGELKLTEEELEVTCYCEGNYCNFGSTLTFGVSPALVALLATCLLAN